MDFSNSNLLPLIQQVNAGNNDAFEKLIKIMKPATRKFILSVPHDTSISYDDLEQECNLALWKCCKSYVPNHDATFFAFFRKSAKNAILSYIYKFQTPMTIKSWEYAGMSELNKFRQTFYAAHGASPGLDDYLLAGFEKSRCERFCALTTQIENDPVNIADITESCADDSTSEYDRVILESMIDELDEIQRDVIRMRYFQNLTYNEIANQLNICVQTVRTYETKALKKLKRNFD